MLVIAAKAGIQELFSDFLLTDRFSRLIETSMPNDPYYISNIEIRRLHRLSYRAQQEDHLEVCGVLIVDGNRRIELRFLRNLSRKSYHYKVNLNHIRPIRELIKPRGMKILGTFHSHPVSYAIPGQGDLDGGFYNRIELIYDVCGREAKLWTFKTKASRKTPIEIPLIIECADRQ